MEPFKVICKHEGGKWVKKIPITRIVTYSKLFGLFKSSKIVSEPNMVPGPQKNEICIVINIVNYPDFLGYELSGYPYGGYDSRYFIRLDEFTETQKEIATKAEPVFN